MSEGDDCTFAFTYHVVGCVVGGCVHQGRWGKGGWRKVWDGGVVNSCDGGLAVEVGGERVEGAVEADVPRT